MEQRKILNRYLADNGLNASLPRERILEEFLKVRTHVSAQELTMLLRDKYPDVGQATVFRALKLFIEAGLANAIDFGDGTIRYEQSYARSHHDHLLCRTCGRIEEFYCREIEALQQAISRKYGFRLTGHRLELFGECSQCTGVNGRKVKTSISKKKVRKSGTPRKDNHEEAVKHR